MMLCIRCRKEQNRDDYERLPLLPRHVIRVRQHGSLIALSVEHINRKFNKVNWERDGTKLISRERKFDIDHDLPRSTTLVLHDVTEKDSGTYQCFLRFENEVEYSDPTLIEFHTIKLNKPSSESKTKENKKEIKTRLMHQPTINPSSRHRNVVKYDVIISKPIQTTSDVVREGIFARTTETDIRRILHHGVLLSENSRLHWQALNGHSVVNKINQRFHNTNIRSKTSREYQKKCANIGSLQCTDRHVTFISGDVEYLTLCSYLENGCITNKLEALLESRNLAIIKKYFQKNGYIPNANEKCICVPKKYFETIQTD
eukprot:XP_011434011.1 PREDICTED: uncharacterized protein LOC105332952 [Crassostrea gigas]